MSFFVDIGNAKKHEHEISFEDAISSVVKALDPTGKCLEHLKTKTAVGALFSSSEVEHDGCRSTLPATEE